MTCDADTKKVMRQVARDTAKAVSTNVAKKTVRETLLTLGVNIDDPIKAQETMAGMRKLAEHADGLAAVATHFKDEENVEAIKFAKSAHRVYKSGKTRALLGLFTVTLGSWWTGLLKWFTSLLPHGG